MPGTDRGHVMAVDANGNYVLEDDSVANRVAKITSGGSDMMKMARTQGMQAANRRGLGNSTMAIGAAEASALNAAVPIASQEASQVAQRNIAGLGEAGTNNRLTRTIDADAERARMTIAADAQKSMLSGVTDLTGNRFTAISNTLQNDKIPAATRAAVQSSIDGQYNQALDYIQNIYGASISNPVQQQAVAPAGLTAAQAAALQTARSGGLFRA